MQAIPRRALAALIACLCFIVPICAQDLPQRISDEDFWQMVSDFSEAGGSFHSDNFVSNETLFQRVVPDLKKNSAGGAYIGVGPDQNFTYLIAIQPRIAFIIDIRRQAVLQHLMFKAIIELSEDRTDFLSRLFSRSRPASVGADSTPAELIEAYHAASGVPALFDENLKAVLDHLSIHHGFGLSDIDRENIEHVYRAFFREGPDIAYVTGAWPTYAQLMVATDVYRQNHGYLGSEANFRILRELQANNLVIPIVGDFAGSKAIRSVAEYLKERHTVVRAFYTSNVEQYLFQQGNWRKFYLNVAELPVDPQSTFIRWIPKGSRQTTALKRNRTTLSPITEFMQGFTDGEIRSYRDVLLLSN